jgi:hypothetical protein
MLPRLYTMLQNVNGQQETHREPELLIINLTLLFSYHNDSIVTIF